MSPYHLLRLFCGEDRSGGARIPARPLENGYVETGGRTVLDGVRKPSTS
jgi:hypothetical protein